MKNSSENDFSESEITQANSKKSIKLIRSASLKETISNRDLSVSRNTKAVIFRINKNMWIIFKNIKKKKILF